MCKVWRYLMLILALTGAFLILSGVVAIPSRPVIAQSVYIDSPKTSSDGAMHGVTLQRSRVYNSRGLSEPTSLLWQTERLFVLKQGATFSGQMGTISYFGWLPTDYGVSHPFIVDNTIYFTLSVGDSYLYALDINTGKDRKRFRLKDVSLSPPAIAGQVVYLGRSDGGFLALDRTTGEIKWQIERKEYQFDVTAPLIADGVLYFGGAQRIHQSGVRPDGTVHALDAGTRREQWTVRIKGVPTSAAIAGELICFGDMDRQLFALDRKTGQEKWRFKAGSNVGSPAVMGDSVYFRDESGNLYRINLASGQLQWKATAIKAQTQLALDNGIVYFGGKDNSVYAVGVDNGAEKWRFKTNGACSSPVLANGVVYFVCADKMIYAVNASTGQEKWHYKSKNAISMSPLIGDGVMYFLDESGYMYAMH